MSLNYQYISDLNNPVYNGFSYAYYPANAPSMDNDAGMMVYTFDWFNDHITMFQVAFLYGDDKIWARCRYDGNWKAWKQLTN